MNFLPLPPPAYRIGHPCNPRRLRGLQNDIYYIQVNDNGQYDMHAPFKLAIPDPNQHGCYRLEQQGGRRRKYKKTKKYRRNTKKYNTTLKYRKI